MMMSFGFIAAYTVLIAIGSVIEVPIARGFASVQINLLIRLGGLAVAILALVIVHGVAVPTGPPCDAQKCHPLRRTGQPGSILIA